MSRMHALKKTFEPRLFSIRRAIYLPLGYFAAMAGLALVPEAVFAQQLAPAPPLEPFLRVEVRTALEARVQKGLRDLNAVSALDRDRAALELGELGALAEAPLLREIAASGSSLVRRSGLRALFRIGPAPSTVELAWSWAENPTLGFDRRSFAILELGGGFAREPERAERAARLGKIAATSGALAESAAWALVRLRTRGAEAGALRSIMASHGSTKSRGALALYLGRVDPESHPAIAELGARAKSDWLRAACWLALANASKRAPDEVWRDVESEDVVLSLCAAMAVVPRDNGEVDQLMQRLDAEQRFPVVGGFALALGASGLIHAEEMLATRATDLAVRTRAPLLQAALRLRSPRVLAAIHRRTPIDARESAMDFAALAGLRCFGLKPGEDLIERDAERSKSLAEVLESARRHLKEGTADGAAEAALALALYARAIPSEANELARSSRDLALVLRVARLMETGHCDSATVRRVGIALALRRGVDPDAWSDLALHHLATSALGHEAIAFSELRAREVDDPREPGPNLLVLPSDEPLPPIAKTSDYYADLVFWLRTRPMRTPLELYLARS